MNISRKSNETFQIHTRKRQDQHFGIIIEIKTLAHCDCFLSIVSVKSCLLVEKEMSGEKTGQKT